MPAAGGRGHSADAGEPAVRIEAGTAAGGCGSRWADVFVGRERELAELSEALAEAQGGRGSVAVLAGEAGIGKTRTTREFAAHAQDGRARVLWGLCYEGEETPSYGPWMGCLRQLTRGTEADLLSVQMGRGAADIAELLPELRDRLAVPAPPSRLEPAEARSRRFDSLIEYLKAASRERCLVFVLDNLQWADPASLQFLEHLAAGLERSAILVIGSYREDELHRRHPLERLLGELVKYPSFRRLRLEGLGQRELGLFLEQTTDSPPSPGLVERIHERTAGNPLFVVELVRDLREHLRPEGWEDPLPEGVRAAIRRRLCRLPEECVRILSQAAVIGRSFELKVLVRVAGPSTLEHVLRAAERAAAAGIIEEAEAPGCYRFRHVLIQETLLEELSAPRRLRCHVRVAEAMEALYGPNPGARTGELVRHLAEAAEELGTEKLVRFTLLAAERALDDYAPDQALALLDRALAIAAARGGTGAETLREEAALREARGRALSDLSDDAAADSLIRSFDLYEKLGDKPRAIAVALTPSRQVRRIGSFESSLWVNTGVFPLVERALAMAVPGSVEEGRLLVMRMARPGLARALGIAREHEDEGIEMRALAHLAVLHTYAGEFELSEREEERALEISRRLSDRVTMQYLLYWRVYRSMILGDLEAAWAACLSEHENAELARSRHLSRMAEMGTAQVTYHRGEWDACRAAAGRVLSLATPRCPNFGLQQALTNLAMVEFETGRFAEGKRHLDVLGELSHCAEAPAPFCMAWIARITGDTSRLEAAEALMGKMGPASTFSYEWWNSSRQAALAVTAALRGDAAAAAAALEYFLPGKGRWVPASAAGKTCDYLLGLLCTTLGRLDEAVAHFEDAAGFCCRTGLRPELAWIHLDCARALIRRDLPGDGERAAESLRQGLALCRELGMRPLAAKMEHGVHEIERALPGPPYPAGLTEREVEVIRLVARGYTNREIGERLFISPDTAARHMHNLLDKTGMANRAEVTAYAMRAGLIRM